MPTIQGGALIGWYERDDAVHILRSDCDFGAPLTEAEAEARWRPYRDRVEALPPRDSAAPPELLLDQLEERAARQFMAHHRNSANILRVIKVDPMRLIAKQLIVVTERSERYRREVRTASGWLQKALDTTRQAHQIRANCGVMAMDLEVPHGEFVTAFNPNGTWEVQETARHVSVTGFQGRMMLWAGYHRSYARVSIMAPDAIDRSLVVALTTDGDFFVSQASPNQGLRDTLCGLRPPLFADFFDDDFFMRIPLKRRRFVLQVRARTVPVDA